jgi:hypothetical protein
LITSQNRHENEDDAEHASRSSGLLRMKVSWARVSQSSLKTGGGATQMVPMTSSWRSHGDEVKNGWVDAMGCIRLFSPNFTVFVVLGHKGTLVISFLIIRTRRAGREVSIQPSLSHP